MRIQHSRYANRLEVTAREGYNYPGATAGPWDKGNDTVNVENVTRTRARELMEEN